MRLLLGQVWQSFLAEEEPFVGAEITI